jgi:hypothetical protein
MFDDRRVRGMKALTQNAHRICSRNAFPATAHVGLKARWCSRCSAQLKIFLHQNRRSTKLTLVFDSSTAGLTALGNSSGFARIVSIFRSYRDPPRVDLYLQNRISTRIWHPGLFFFSCLQIPFQCFPDLSMLDIGFLLGNKSCCPGM